MCGHVPLNLGESLPQDLQRKFDAAVSQIRLSKGAVVALSAGVDSSLVALLARKALGDHAVAVTGVSESLPPHGLEVAKGRAKEIALRHVVVQNDVLQDPQHSSYHAYLYYSCRATLYGMGRSRAASARLQATI